jgi:hypothetical protein
MNREQRRSFLIADLAQVDAMLRELPDSSFSRLSLEHRKAEIAAELKHMAERPGHVATAIIAFDGTPVEGNQAIEAEFGGSMLYLTQQLVWSVNADTTRALASRGTLPSKPAASLMITGTVHQSFGFELRERHPTLFESPTTKALSAVFSLVRAAGTSDDAFLDEISDWNPRVAKALKRFFVKIDHAGAGVKMSSDSETLRFSHAEVATVARRVSNPHVTVEFVHVDGLFTGVFAEAFRFEFVPDAGEKMEGRISDDRDPVKFKQLIGLRCSVYLQQTETSAPGQTTIVKFTLLEATELPDDGSSSPDL